MNMAEFMAEFIVKCNEKLKLIRIKYNSAQEKIAQILELSKNAAVEIEKGCSSLGWNDSVILFTLFGNREIPSAVFGGNPKDIIMPLTLEGHAPLNLKTTGDKIGRKLIEEQKALKMQQNIISQHYGILDGENRRLCSSFDPLEMGKRFAEVYK